MSVKYIYTAFVASLDRGNNFKWEGEKGKIEEAKTIQDEKNTNRKKRQMGGRAGGKKGGGRDGGTEGQMEGGRSLF